MPPENTGGAQIVSVLLLWGTSRRGQAVIVAISLPLLPVVSVVLKYTLRCLVVLDRRPVKQKQ